MDNDVDNIQDLIDLLEDPPGRWRRSLFNLLLGWLW